ncbi:MAG TPA: hypothetical protein QGH10_04310 [Armatimonadota bacterium]|nr:hypothetical protein [Armatimonadota bacterium]
MRLGNLTPNCAMLVAVALLGPGAQALGQDGAEERLPGRFVFTSNEDNDPGDIYAVSATGADRVRLTRNPAYDGHPSWAPDGSEIAFWSTRGGNAGDIYTMQANGQGVMRLTRHVARDALPAWS